MWLSKHMCLQLISVFRPKDKLKIEHMNHNQCTDEDWISWKSWKCLSSGQSTHLTCVRWRLRWGGVLQSSVSQTFYSPVLFSHLTYLKLHTPTPQCMNSLCIKSTQGVLERMHTLSAIFGWIWVSVIDFRTQSVSVFCLHACQSREPTVT